MATVPAFHHSTRNYSSTPTHSTGQDYSSTHPLQLSKQRKSKMSQPHINDNINNSFNNTNSFNNVWNNCTMADEKSQILAWLSLLEPQIRHHDIQTRRIDEVGDWLMQTEEYRNWFDGIRGSNSDGSALFCYGGPGVGKTYISSLVIDTLCKQVMEGNAAVACFYFDFAVQESQYPAAVLGSVLKQVVGGLDQIPERIAIAFRQRSKAIGGQRLSLSEIVEFLRDISSSQRTFICIDALDECRPGHRVKLLDSLNQILHESPGTRIFLTGRPYIQDEVEKHLAGRALTRCITPSKNDIVAFLRATLKEDTMPGAMDKGLEDEIMQNIPETVSEMFLLVFLGIEVILQETTIYRRRQKLKAMEGGVDLRGAYGATLGRIKAQGGEKARLGMAVLMWISHSRRPLQADEICRAIAIRIGSNGLSNDDIPEISTLLSCCQGLATIEKSTSTVRLIHFTLQEYLRTHSDLFDRAHSVMAETCLTYLNFQRVKDLSSGPPPDSRGIPFLEYASLYWGTHMRMELSDRAKTFAIQLLGQFDGHISAKSLWKSINRGLPRHHYSGNKPFSALHCISYFGIAEVTNILIKMDKWDVNEIDGAGVTPLIWAAKHGHDEVVRLLLRMKNIQPGRRDSFGRTALSWAAGNGHDEVVRLFLGRNFANPGSIGGWWGEAARVVGVLFGWRYVNPDSSSNSGQTPFCWAAENGHERIVKLLLARKDVGPNGSASFHKTPLLLAAENGHEGIVKLLLGREDVNLNSSNNGLTLLIGAAANGHEGIVKLLLGRDDVDPDSSGKLRGTPLWWATKNGHEGVVKLLLGWGDANPNTPGGNFDRTPLSLAAGNGHEGIVKLLLARKDVNPNGSTKFDQTPLSLAAENGHEEIVKLLLGWEDVNPGTSDMNYGRTPLLRAAANGHEGIVKLLLGREDVNPDASDMNYGRTPLLWAAKNGHEGIVKLLLGREDVNPNSSSKPSQTLHFGPWSNSSKHGRMPLSWAAGNGHEGIVKLLLGRQDVSPDVPDTAYGRTPLSWAAGNGHEGVVRLLLEREDVNPNISSQSGQTPLMLATENKHKSVVKLLQAQRPRHIR